MLVHYTPERLIKRIVHPGVALADRAALASHTPTELIYATEHCQSSPQNRSTWMSVCPWGCQILGPQTRRR